jgi:hypothetical protein
MLPKHRTRTNYEVLPSSAWKEHTDRTTCDHHTKPHPSILVEKDGWYAQCKMAESLWSSLVVSKSEDVVMSDCEHYKPTERHLKSYDLAYQKFTTYLYKKPFTDTQILEKFLEYREEVWEKLVTEDRDWRTLHRDLSIRDLGKVWTALGKHYFEDGRGPSQWAKARGYNLKFEVVKASHTYELFKAAGSCGPDGGEITITAARVWLRDHTRGSESIRSVGNISMSHHFDEFCHFLSQMFDGGDDGEDGHGHIWQRIFRNMFGLKTQFYQTYVSS